MKLTKTSIPETLEDCFQVLNLKLSQFEIDQLLSLELKDLCKNRNLIKWIRTHWFLWKSSPLRTYFLNMGVKHGDEMAEMILESFWCSLKDK